MAGSKDDSWDYLFGKDIPFKGELHVLAWHLPGIICAFALGLLINWLLEETLKLFSRRASEHPLVTVVWVALVIYMIFFSRFDHWVAEKISWNKVCSRPLQYQKAPPAVKPAR
jgi:formate/nitrite transporter FocA (FNT family)